MKKSVYIIIWGVVICSGCQCQNKTYKKALAEFNQKAVNNYKQGLSFFGEKLTRHFPKKLPDSAYSLVTGNFEKDTIPMEGFGSHSMYLKVNYLKEEYRRLVNVIKDTAKAHYSTIDTSMLLIFSYSNSVIVDGRTFTDLEPLEKRQLAARNKIQTNKLPVPSFEHTSFSDDKAPTGLDGNYVYYVLDAVPGYNLPQDRLYECDCLPTEWKHGYSKGVALNDKERVVIYWVTVW